MTAHEIAARLNGKPSSKGKWSARCPAHDDEHPSLSIAEGDDRRTLLRCQAGCSVETVVRACGLTLADLFAEPRASSHGKSRALSEYEYSDENGKVLYVVERRGPKSFVQKVPDGSGGWRYKLDGVRRVPYRLPELLEAIARGETIYVVEGEKDAEALAKLGLCATTGAQGATWKWPAAWAEFFRGAKSVVVLTDCDAPGRKAAQQRAASIATVCANVCVLDLAPKRRDGYDVSDWLDEDHGLNELFERVDAASRVVPAPAADSGDEIARPQRTVRLVPASEITPVETRYVVEPYVPRGEATWLEGITKTGKTMVAIDLIARLTRGDVLPPTRTRIERGRAVILTCEDSPERTIVPRLIAAEADLDRVRIVRVEEEGAERIPSFVYDSEAIEKQLAASEADLLMVDGTFGVLGVEDGHSYTEAYQRMLPLVAMVRRLDIGAIIVRHVRKTEATALNRGIGSVGYASLARSTVSVALDRDDETGARRLWAHAGSNAGETGPTLSFTIVGAVIEGLTRAVGRVVWGEVVAVTADEAMRDGRTPDDRSAIDAACDLLNDLLAVGPVKSLDVYAAADRAHISRATLRRAATKLGVERRRDGERGPWLMTLPD